MRKLLKFAVIPVIAAAIAITLMSGGRYDGGRDLVDELFEQAVKQNDNLKSIEDDIDRFYKKKSDAIAEFNGYNNYNSRYYSDARQQVNGISDPATKQRATDQINQSETAYKTKISNWQAAISEMNARERELSDLRILLKIISTRPMIEKYQSDRLPDNGKLRDVNEEIKRVIERIKILTK